jgi:hypothetical protein
VQKSEGLIWKLTRMVCDFIRDENDNWWFIQLKGFNLDPETELHTKRWIHANRNKQRYVASSRIGLGMMSSARFMEGGRDNSYAAACKREIKKIKEKVGSASN